MTVLLPILLVLLFIGVQAALLHQARSLSIAAASAGAHAAGAEHGTAGAGVAAAEAFLAKSGDDAFSTWSVEATMTDTTARITVTGVSLSIVPFWTPEIRHSSTVAREEVSAP